MRIYASLLSTDCKECIEIDNIEGEARIRRWMEDGKLRHGEYYTKEEIAKLCNPGWIDNSLTSSIATKPKYQFLAFDNVADWAKRCV